jgi:hypothetical protein
VMVTYLDLLPSFPSPDLWLGHADARQVFDLPELGRTIEKVSGPLRS